MSTEVISGITRDNQPVCVRAYSEGDEEAINNSFNDVFGLKRTVDQWKIKFGVDGQNADIIIAIDHERRVLAHCAGLRTRVWMQEREIICGQSVDVFCLRQARIVEPAIFERCMKTYYTQFCGKNGTSLLFGFPGERHLRLGNLRLGYKPGLPVDYYSRIATVKKIWMPRYSLSEEFEDHTVDYLWRRSRKRFQSAVVRDGKRLMERYGFVQGKKQGHYSYIAARKNGLVCAWAVFCTDAEKFRVVDMLWDGVEPRAVAELFNGLCRLAVEANCPLMEMWLNQDRLLASVLEKLGWEKKQNPENLMASSVSPSDVVDAASFLGGFYFTWGDSDLV